jgi:hypothetical protein
MSKNLKPETALLKLRAILESDDVPRDGIDGRPLHWLVKESLGGGLQFIDSGYMLVKMGYSAINMAISFPDGDRIMTPEELSPLFQRFLDWLGLNLPPTKGWGVEFKLGCPIIPCDRPLVEETNERVG